VKNDSQEPANERLLSSFGRRKGRRLRVTKQGLVDTVLPRLSVALPEEGQVLSPASLFPAASEYWLEIGFGGGEHLAHVAGLYPHVGMIGCEPYINGMADLLRHIDTRGINNIRIYNDDARFLVDTLPDACLSRAYILYPDPWPKQRHHKRRLVNHALLDRLARVLRPGAELRLATDSADYATWMLEHILSHAGFEWTANTPSDWLNPPPDWFSTRYEQKALAGRPTYLNFRRR
jgi:tRNA (guanine-N7-)-methyltransferase